MVAALAVGVAALTVSACQKKEEGVAEATGRQIDNMVKDAADKTRDKAGEAVQKIDQAVADAKDEAKELAQKVGKKIEEAGKKIQDVAKDNKK